MNKIKDSKHVYDREDAERMTPLLRSITRELRDRRAAIARSEHEARLARRQELHDEATAYESELSTHRRELRQVEKELARLGLAIDAENELRILIPSSDGAWAYEGLLDDTQFYRRLEDLPV